MTQPGLNESILKDLNFHNDAKSKIPHRLGFYIPTETAFLARMHGIIGWL